MAFIIIASYKDTNTDYSQIECYLEKMKEELNLSAEIDLLDSYLWINNMKGYQKLNLLHLRFIETEQRHLLFHYMDQEIRHAHRVSEIEKKLPKQLFFRCNNSYIVNLLYIDQIVPEGDRYDIILSTDERVPLSRSRYSEILRLLSIKT